MMDENEVIAQSLLLAPYVGIRLWRNNSGAAYDVTGRLVRYGLGHVSKRHNEVWKSGDCVGIRERDGRFIMFEMKGEDWTGLPRLTAHEQAQANALMDVARAGGIAAFITHPEQLRTLV